MTDDSRPKAANLTPGKGEIIFPDFPTDYYNAGAHYDNARHIPGWYGMAYHPQMYGTLEYAISAALADKARLIKDGYLAKAVMEETGLYRQVRLWHNWRRHLTDANNRDPA